MWYALKRCSDEALFCGFQYKSARFQAQWAVPSLINIISPILYDSLDEAETALNDLMRQTNQICILNPVQGIGGSNV
jgi:hypothetical protein